MTPREAAIISAYTEVGFGSKHFQYFHEYVEEKFGHSVWTHEMADKEFWIKLKELSRDDFMSLAYNITYHENVSIKQQQLDLNKEINMLTDNKLNFISDIESSYIEKIDYLRKLYIDLDWRLREYGKSEDAKKEGALRCLSLARTNLETTLMYTIKALCIMGEKDSL